MKATSRRTLIVHTVLITALILLTPRPTRSYLLEFESSTAGTPCGPNGPNAGSPPCADQWNFSPTTGFQVVWMLNPASAGSNLLNQGTRSVGQVIQASFAPWISAPNANVPVAESANFSTLTRPAYDGTNLIAFTCSSGCDFTGAETLALTFTTTISSSSQVGQAINGHPGFTAQFVGQIVDADILFNPTACFTTVFPIPSGGASTCPAGTTGPPQDLQTVATHEIGHFLGLDHSAVVRAVMFPFAPDVLQTLSYDDVAGLSVLYPKSPPDVLTGTIAGTVRLNGSGVFGAHVFADSVASAQPFAANIRKSPISTLTRPDGSYQIMGVPQDSYTVTAEPLDLPVDNSDVSGYPPVFGRTTVQTNFTTRWH